ncbi:hypothetical protein AB9N12_13150 [Bacteroides sp. AN502(2024)]|uniref:hypothetical protein n=1 Tax=Bacteroides sp. AN502(2024) TaxID=3160599 RepID=UPI003512672B
MNYTRLIIAAITFCLAIPLSAQSYQATIPYQMLGGKMIVEMKVNGHAHPFIFDTGGHTALTAKACQALQIAATDSMKITDVNNVEGYHKTVHIENLTTPDNVINFKNVPSLVINEVKGWECFGVDGVIGSDLFASAIVSIDSQTRTITVTSAERPSTVSLRKMLNFTRDGGMPIISVQIAPASNIDVLFDTGSPGLLSLIESDFENIQSEASMNIVSEGYGEGSVGVAGQADKASSYRIQIPLLSVGAAKFRNLTTCTGKHPYTLLGVKLLEYGKVTIDYPRRRFYLEAFQPDYEINTPCNNFDLTVKDGDLYVSTVWSSTKGKIAVGDKVIKINGKPTKKYDFCESILNGIPELEKKKKTKLTIETASGVKDIIYEKE